MSAYRMLHAGSTPFLVHKLIWKTWAPLRIKIFLWLAFKRRHRTGDRRRRHGLEARELCYLCDQGEETIDHILDSCPVTREIWYYALHAFSYHKQRRRHYVGGEGCAPYSTVSSLQASTPYLHSSHGKFGKNEMLDASGRQRQASATFCSSSWQRPMPGSKPVQMD
jgi:hypothetical protein